VNLLFLAPPTGRNACSANSGTPSEVSKNRPHRGEDSVATIVS
jgi:hypothetical protein